jgi:hypothetical protein
MVPSNADRDVGELRRGEVDERLSTCGATADRTRRPGSPGTSGPRPALPAAGCGCAGAVEDLPGVAGHEAAVADQLALGLGRVPGPNQVRGRVLLRVGEGGVGAAGLGQGEEEPADHVDGVVSVRLAPATVPVQVTVSRPSSAWPVSAAVTTPGAAPGDRGVARGDRPARGVDDRVGRRAGRVGRGFGAGCVEGVGEGGRGGPEDLHGHPSISRRGRGPGTAPSWTGRCRWRSARRRGWRRPETSRAARVN